MTGLQDQAPVPPVTKPVTYEELTPEHKQKYDEVKALFEADLIGSFERTRNHGIRHMFDVKLSAGKTRLKVTD